MPLDKPILLVGPMGAGKTTIGQALAQTLKVSYIDNDDLIITTMRQSYPDITIPEIFARWGEDFFREQERNCLKSIITVSPFPYQVIAGGGGIVGPEPNRALIKHTNRPMLKAPDVMARIKELALKRDPLYREVACAIIDANAPIATVVECCLNALPRS